MRDWVAQLAACQGAPHVLVTVIAVKGSVPRGVGTRMIVDSLGQRHGTLGGGNLERLVLALARDKLGTAWVGRERYPLGAKAGQCCGGVVEVLVESVVPPPRAIVFGAGHVGQALVRVLLPTRFAVTVVEDRPEWVEALPDGVEVYDAGWDLFVDRAELSERDFVVVMTHNHQRDRDILAAVLAKHAGYVGMIGSQAKWRTSRELLVRQGIAEEEVDRVCCPIGLETGGKEPGDIAVSVAAQLMRRFHGVGE